MKRKVHTASNYWLLPHPVTRLYIQAPLPSCLDTLPKLITITGRGSALGRATPSASAEEPANA